MRLYDICMGDFNIDMLDTDSSIPTLLSNILESFCIRQIISQPTRIAKNSSTLIDLICCNPTLVADSGTGDGGIYDHLLTYAILRIASDDPNQDVFCYRQLYRIDLDSFNADLLKAAFNQIYDINGIYDKISYITDIILGIFDVHAPLSKNVGSRKPYRPWVTSNF